MRFPLARCLGIASTLVFFTACLSGGGLGTGVKTVGSSSKSGANTTSDSFAATLAVRDTTVATNRQVQIQGKRNLESAKFVNLCGATGSSCSCSFFVGTSDSAPVTSSAVSLSSDINTFNCTVSGAVAIASYTHVMLKNSDGSKTTGLIPIKASTALTLTDVIGDLDIKKVRKIQRYSCQRTFFEGTGVGANTITCVASQALGVITASYNYYLFTSQLANNISDKTGDVAFDSAICSNNNFLKISCSSSVLDDRYGLYAENAAPFNVLITYTAKPDVAPTTATTGFAALPDSSGNCPLGLIKVRPWIASPPSITAGSLGSNPASNFINNGSLNNTIVEDASTTPAVFSVSRAPNATPCTAVNTPNPGDSGGDCSGITLGAAGVAVSTNYSSLTPVICAIPKSLLTGI